MYARAYKEATMTEDMIEYIKKTERQDAKLDVITQSLQKVDERMTKLEALREQDIKQNEKIEQILVRLDQDNTHFDKIEQRLAILEQADGHRAKEVIKQVVSIFLATVVGAIIANLGIIFK